MNTEPATWEKLIPRRLGNLPLGGDLTRTDAGSSPSARIAILGVYPAATKWRIFKAKEHRLKLPNAVEKTSFEATSASGRELDETYLAPLGLNRKAVFLFDMMPYFFANTSVGKNGRSMWTNIEIYEKESGHKTAVRPRPEPDKLLVECREMPGNSDRLADYMQRCAPELLLTLGNEGAAFVRGDLVAKDAQPHLLGDPVEMEVLGVRTRVVHLPHPGIVMKNDDWRDRHGRWCRESQSSVASIKADLGS